MKQNSSAQPKNATLQKNAMQQDDAVGHNNVKSKNIASANCSPFSVITPDGIELKGQLHLLPQPKATIYIIHGFSEHQGRYEYLVAQFLTSGFQVVTYDHRGHGISEGKRGYTPKFSFFVADLLTVLQQTRKHLQHSLQTPNFLHAHSMGGGITLNAVLTQFLPIAICGVIASSPWLQVTTPPSWIKLLAGQITRKILPQLTMPSDIKPNSLTHDPVLEAAYFSDPLVHQQISSELFFGTQEAGEASIAMAPRWQVPMLLMHGDLDPVTAFSSSVQFYQHAPKDLVEFKTWPGLFHETHNEINRDEVIDFVIQWILKTIGNATPPSATTPSARMRTTHTEAE